MTRFAKGKAELYLSFSYSMKKSFWKWFWFFDPYSLD